MNSRFFTPQLTAKDKRALFDILGFTKCPYVFLESEGGLLLQALEFGSSGETFHMHWWTVGDWEIDASFAARSCIHLKHDREQLGVVSSVAERSLWEDIFPFPFSLAARAFTKADLQVELAPDSFREYCYQLWCSLNIFEQMGDAEVVVLWVRSGMERFALLFHRVRRKRVRVGTLDRLYELGRAYDNKDLSKQKLRDFFGTSAIFCALDAPEVSEHELISALSDKIRCLFKDRGRVIQTAPFGRQSFSSDFELGL